MENISDKLNTLFDHQIYIQLRDQLDGDLYITLWHQHYNKLSIEIDMITIL